MRVLVINCSHPHYNLGAAKLAEWLKAEGHDVETAKGDPGLFALGYDLVCLSVIFSWHAPVAVEIALRVKASSDVWAGGPGLFKVGKWFESQTGIKAAHGIDRRFDKHRGSYRATFASRGCPVGCSFCIVPGLEGRKFTLDYEFVPAPLLYDNNLSALPADFQDHIITRYRETETPLADANSGFEPRTFDESVYQRWKPILRGAWRFALDDCDELNEVESMMRVLKDVPASRKRVYVLIGNEPIARCHERAQKVIEWGGEPFCQPILPLDWLRDPRADELPASFDWTSQKLKDFARFYNRWFWRSLSLAEYKPRLSEPPPFGSMALPPCPKGQGLRVEFAEGHQPVSVTVNDTTASVAFDKFGRDAYDLFLKVKRLPESQISYDYEWDIYTVTTPARFAHLLGAETPRVEASPLPLSDFLFDDQRAIVRMALDAKRFAVWSDCGLGKTLVQLEWARHVAHMTGGRVLTITLNDIVAQTIDEADNFYGGSLPLYRIETREEMRLFCAGKIGGASQIAITNYEKMNPDEQGQVVSEMRHLAGLVLDESSRLKTGGGKQKWALIKSSKGIPYKLSCTATPAPNDLMEFASQASFLERMRDEAEIIWTFFRRDPKTNEWTVKRHARRAFFEFMAGWSIYMRDPRRYGWRLDFEPPPPPVTFEHRIGMTPAQAEALARFNTDSRGQVSMFAQKNLGITSRAKLSQIAKGFVYEKRGAKTVALPVESMKPAFVVDLIRKEVEAGLQVLVWTVFDEETGILARLLNREPVMFDALSGATNKEERALMLEDFRKGESQVLISKASLLGYGMNFQMCGSMVFSGWNDSYEQFYQAIRRAYRFGQTRSVRVHVPFIPELEGMVLENVLKKQAHFEESVSEMESAYIGAMKSLQLAEAK